MQKEIQTKEREESCHGHSTYINRTQMAWAQSLACRRYSHDLACVVDVMNSPRTVGCWVAATRIVKRRHIEGKAHGGYACKQLWASQLSQLTHAFKQPQDGSFSSRCIMLHYCLSSRHFACKVASGPAGGSSKGPAPFGNSGSEARVGGV